MQKKKTSFPFKTHCCQYAELKAHFKHTRIYDVVVLLCTFILIGFDVPPYFNTISFEFAFIRLE